MMRELLGDTPDRRQRAVRTVRGVRLTQVGTRDRVDRIELTYAQPRGRAFTVALRTPMGEAEVAALFVQASRKKPSAAELSRFIAASRSSLGQMAREIEDLRVLYEASTKFKRNMEPERRRHRRIVKALATLRRDLIASELAGERRDGNAIVIGNIESAFSVLERFVQGRGWRPLSEPWHVCATKIAAEYSILFDTSSRWSRDSFGVRFVKAALKEITGRDFTANAIELALARARRPFYPAQRPPQTKAPAKCGETAQRVCEK